MGLPKIPLLYPNIIVPGFLSGILWSLADICWFISNEKHLNKEEEEEKEEDTLRLGFAEAGKNKKAKSLFLSVVLAGPPFSGR